MATAESAARAAAEVERASTEKIYIPPVDIFEDENRVILYFDLPGVDEQSVDIMLEKNILTVEGRAASHFPEELPAVNAEYGVGNFRRSFQLQDEYDQDGIEANMKDGVLRVVLPRVAPVKRKISVTAG